MDPVLVIIISVFVPFEGQIILNQRSLNGLITKRDSILRLGLIKSISMSTS